MGEETLRAEGLEVGCSEGGGSLGAPRGCWGRGTVLPCGRRLQQGREGEGSGWGLGGHPGQRWCPSA